MTSQELKLGVIIPTYRRSGDLARCLRALALQEALPDEVIVTVRHDDQETIDFLQNHGVSPFPIRSVVLLEPGIVAARNAGLEASRAKVMSFLDDDTAPHPDWARRIIDHFDADRSLGALGGKDCLHDGNRFNEGRSDRVGKVHWFGRIVPDHHLGHGAAREVDMIKGANMSLRASAVANIRFESRLRGKGAQPFEDLAFSLEVRRSGWKLLYDPNVIVDHFSGARDETRHYATLAPVTDTDGFRDFAFNEVVAYGTNFLFGSD